MARTDNPRHSSNIPSLRGRTVKGGHMHPGVYCLEKNIGHGTWGAVYRASALHMRTRSKFAIKCLTIKDLSASKIRRMEREIEIQEYCHDITDGSTLRLHDWFRDDEEHLLYIISEYCPGGDLLDRILKLEYFGNDEIVRDLCLQLLDTVETLHDGGVYHRDLKPENILFKNDGKQLLIADFGLSTTREYNTDCRFLVLSVPRYVSFVVMALPCTDKKMSPEVQGGLTGRLAALSSSKADIWALGVMFFNIALVEIPWLKAELKDEIFGEYYYMNRDVLLRRSVVSEEFNDVLKSIFRINPLNRASIPEIRTGIRAIKTFYNRSDPRFQKRYERVLRIRAAAEESRKGQSFFSSSSEISNSEDSVSSAISSPEPAVPVPGAPKNTAQGPLIVTNPDPTPAKQPIQLTKNVDRNRIVDLAQYEFTFVYGGANNAPTFCDTSEDSAGPVTPEQPAVDNAGTTAVLEDINNLDLDDNRCSVAIAVPAAVYDQGRPLATHEEVCEEVKKIQQYTTKPKTRFNKSGTPDLREIGRRSSMIISSVARMLRFPENVL